MDLLPQLRKDPTATLRSIKPTNPVSEHRNSEAAVPDSRQGLYQHPCSILLFNNSPVAVVFQVLKDIFMAIPPEERGGAQLPGRGSEIKTWLEVSRELPSIQLNNGVCRIGHWSASEMAWKPLVLSKRKPM